MKTALFGDLLDFTADPGLDAVARAPQDTRGLRWRPGHWLLIDGERIAGTSAEPPGDDWQRVDHAGRLILPGFIDTHVHSPQLDVIASYGTELIEWLETYTFPAEARYADEAVARDGAERFCDALLAHGTTSAAVYPTVHRVSCDTLFEAAAARGMRLVAGKVLMDRHAPANLSDTVESAERDSLALVERWHGRGRAAYALTVRFAATSSPEQMAMAGRLLRDIPGLYMQTHVAESRAEVEWIRTLFPDARSYLDVYRRHGLLNERAILAHGIWLDAEDRRLLADTGAQIAHSPTSNLFLGSGLFDWQAAEAAGHAVSLATDVGGGTGLSMIRTMAEAYKVQALRGTKLTAWKALHTATRGAARALRLDHEIGSFDTGTQADVCVWDWAAGLVAAHRDQLARGDARVHERLFAWMTLADERNLKQAWVAGTPRWRRPHA